METRTYTVTASPEAFLSIERMLFAMYLLGSFGASRRLVVHVDGDGGFKAKTKELVGTEYDKRTFEAALDEDLVNVATAIQSA